MVVTRLESVGICSKLKVRQVTAIGSNYIVVFAAILSAQSKLGADSKASAKLPFQVVCFQSSQYPPLMK